MSRARRSAALVLSLLVGASLGACSKDDPPNPFPGNDTMPGNSGSTCEDRTADLSKDAKSLGGNLAAPSGADIVRAEARLTEKTLRVEMTMATPIIGTPDPDYVLAQGLPNEETAFELHAEPADSGAQTWRLRLVRYRKDARGFVSQVVPDTVLSTPVKVDGATLSYEVAQTDIPRVASYVWQFGSSAASPEGGGRVLDVCDGAGPAGPDDTTGSSAPGTTAPPAKLLGKVGETLDHNTGAKVTVHEVQDPPQGAPADTTPADPGMKLVAANVEVCAPAANTLPTGALFFFVEDDKSVLQPRKSGVAVPPKQPALPDTLTLAAGDCDRSWVTFQIDQGANPKTVVYGTDRSSAGALQFELA